MKYPKIFGSYGSNFQSLPNNFCQDTRKSQLSDHDWSDDLIYSESKQMTITIAHFTTISGHFSANCMFIFHKKEVQTVILRCLTGLNIDWFKNYGLRCKWRPRACLANFQNIATDKWTFYYHIWPFFCQLYGYLSQKIASDGHFKVFKESKS